MIIRAATPDDLPLMIELDRASATAAHWSEDQYRKLLTPERLVLAASTAANSSLTETNRGGKESLVGFLVARQIAPEWELENIIVAPFARRKGIGEKLLNALIAAARKTNSEVVFLEVRESNDPARALYARAGFEQTGRRKSYYANPLEDAVLYRLALH